MIQVNHAIRSRLAVGALLLFAIGASAPTETASKTVILTGGFRDHVRPVQGGRIDWTNGFILAEGIGQARDRSEQEHLKAQRAGELIAARNALAMAQGIQIDSKMRIGGLRDGSVRIQGLVRRHKMVESLWRPDTDPPTCKVTLRVPLWGVEGLASLYCRTQRVWLSRAHFRRIALNHKQEDVSDFVLVIDARGHDISTCLFPEIMDTEGRVLCDLATLPPAKAMQIPPARYVESDISFEQLQAMIKLDAAPRSTSAVSCFSDKILSASVSFARPWLRSDASLRFMLADYRPPQEKKAGPANNKAASRPASQPAKHIKRRAKRRMAVRVNRITGKQKTQLVLTKQDAERLRKSPKAANAIKKAQVLIVVDAPAAGTEGRLPLEQPDDITIALMNP